MEVDADLEMDYMISLQLAMEEEEEEKRKTPRRAPVTSIVDPQLELSDPNPSAHALFVDFNVTYFWGKLGQVMVDWSGRMTRCAGVCSFQPRSGLCSIRLSAPLLALRPRRDLVETLLHEMIHAYIFIVHRDRDREAHGPVFQSHMHRINAIAGTNITIYHTFHDEVESHQKHWWKCSGPCQNRPPFFGILKRAMNRAPSARDFWWPQHQRECGGIFVKIKEPEYKKSKGGRTAPTTSAFTVKGGILTSKSPPSGKKRGGSDIRNFFSPKNPKLDSSVPLAASSSTSSQTKEQPKGGQRPSDQIRGNWQKPSSQVPLGRPQNPHKTLETPQKSPLPTPQDVRIPPASANPPPRANLGSQLFRRPGSQQPNVRTIQSSHGEVSSRERFPGHGKTLGGMGHGRSRLLSLYTASGTS